MKIYLYITLYLSYNYLKIKLPSQINVTHLLKSSSINLRLDKPVLIFVHSPQYVPPNYQNVYTYYLFEGDFFMIGYFSCIDSELINDIL